MQQIFFFFFSFFDRADLFQIIKRFTKNWHEKKMCSRLSNIKQQFWFTEQAGLK